MKITEIAPLKGYDIDSQASEKGYDTNYHGFDFESKHYVIDIDDWANVERPKFYRVASYDLRKLHGTGVLVDNKILVQRLKLQWHKELENMYYD